MGRHRVQAIATTRPDRNAITIRRERLCDYGTDARRRSGHDNITGL